MSLMWKQNCFRSKYETGKTIQRKKGNWNDENAMSIYIAIYAVGVRKANENIESENMCTKCILYLTVSSSKKYPDSHFTFLLHTFV